MKKQYAILADLHFGVKKFDKNFLGVQLDYFNQEAFPFLLEQGIKDVIIAGDSFEEKELVDIYVLHNVIDKFFNFFTENKINCYIIMGNHDFYYKHNKQYHIYSTLKHHPYIHIIEEPFILDDNITLFPWQSEIKQETPYAIGHFEIGGFLPALDGHQKISDFKGFKQVFSGHFHNRMEQDNIQYVGSPYAMRWDDFKVKKGFDVLTIEDDTYSYEFIENTTSPKFIIVKYNQKEKGKPIITIEGLKGDKVEVDEKKLKEIAKSNFVKIVIEQADDWKKFEKVTNDIQTVKPTQNKSIEMSVFEEDFDGEIDANVTNDDLIKKYFDDYLHYPTSINKEKTKDIFYRLYKSS